MSDVQERAVTPVARGAAGGSCGVRRVGRWSAAVLVAGAAVTLGAGPAGAVNPPQPSLQVLTVPGTDYPGDPVAVIAPGQTGAVTFGIKDTSRYPTATDRWTMVLYAPSHAAFADDSLTPVGDAAGSWSCTRATSAGTGIPNSAMTCTSTYAGPPPAAAGAQWKANIAVLPDAPDDTVQADGYAILEVHSPNTDPMFYRWDTPHMTLAFRTPPCPVQQV